MNTPRHPENTTIARALFFFAVILLASTLDLLSSERTTEDAPLDTALDTVPKQLITTQHIAIIGNIRTAQTSQH